MSSKVWIVLIGFVLALTFAWSELAANQGKTGKGGDAPLVLEADLLSAPGLITFRSFGEPEAPGWVAFRFANADPRETVVHQFAFDQNGEWSWTGPLAALEGIGPFQADITVAMASSCHGLQISEAVTLRMDVYSPETSPVTPPATGTYYAPVSGTIAPLFPVQWSSTHSLGSEHVLVFRSGPTGVEGEIPVN